MLPLPSFPFHKTRSGGKKDLEKYLKENCIPRKKMALYSWAEATQRFDWCCLGALGRHVLLGSCNASPSVVRFPGHTEMEPAFWFCLHHDDQLCKSLAARLTASREFPQIQEQNACLPRVRAWAQSPVPFPTKWSRD